MKRSFKKVMSKHMYRKRKMYNGMNIALIGSPNYENVRDIREFIFKIKNKFGDSCNIITRGNKSGCEKYVKKYAIDFGLRYTEFNSANTAKNLYSGMNDSYYNKPFHPTQKLHQYDCIVRNSDKIFYFGGIKPSERRHFEKLLKRFNKSVVYLG